MNKKTTIAFSALALSLVLASCGGKGEKLDPNQKTLPEEVDTYKTIYGTDPNTFATYATNHQPNSMHYCNFIDGLVENDNYGRLVPALAKDIPSMVEEKDGTFSYTFTLKDNLNWAKWNDKGDELVKAGDVTAYDFELAAKLALDPVNEGGTSYLYFTFIKGSEDYYNAQIKPKDAPDDWKPDPDKLNELWSKVGVKAIDEKTIKYTLNEAKDYFPTVLTYGCYFPVPTQLYNQITSKYGVVDNKAKYNLWYNGAFALKDYKNNSKIKYAKNPLYWDKDSVHLNNVEMMWAPSDADQAWARIQFEQGNMDSFRVQEIDKAGWKEYVLGKDGTGSQDNPADPWTNSIESTPDSSTFYLGFNFNRTKEGMQTTNLNKAEVENFEKAISNKNFRKAILYAVDKGESNKRYTPSNPNQWTANLYTVPTVAVDDNGRDYTEYVFDVYAEKNNISVEEAKKLISNGSKGLLDPVKSKEFLAVAEKEMKADGVTFPIKLELIQRQNDAFTGYYNAFEQALQNNLDPSKKIVEVSTKQLNNELSNKAFYNHDYSVSTDFGWGPDYGDPMAFLGTFIKGGDLTPNMGLTEEPLAEKVIGDYTRKVEAASLEKDKSKKFKMYAEAEVQLLFEDVLIIPLTQPLQGKNVTVTKVRPKTAQLAPYGVGKDKLKGTVVYKSKLNKHQFNSIIEEYNAGKK